MPSIYGCRVSAMFPKDSAIEFNQKPFWNAEEVCWMQFGMIQGVEFVRFNKSSYYALCAEDWSKWHLVSSLLERTEFITKDGIVIDTTHKIIKPKL